MTEKKEIEEKFMRVLDIKEQLAGEVTDLLDDEVISETLHAIERVIKSNPDFDGLSHMDRKEVLWDALLALGFCFFGPQGKEWYKLAEDNEEICDEMAELTSSLIALGYDK